MTWGWRCPRRKVASGRRMPLLAELRSRGRLVCALRSLVLGKGGTARESDARDETEGLGLGASQGDAGGARSTEPR